MSKCLSACLSLSLFAALGAVAQTDVGNITGVVRDELGRTVAGVTVELLDASNDLSSSTAGPNGEYGFNAVTPGAFTMGAGGDGFLSSIRNVTIGGGRTRRVDFILNADFEDTRPQIRALAHAAPSR